MVLSFLSSRSASLSIFVTAGNQWNRFKLLQSFILLLRGKLTCTPIIIIQLKESSLNKNINKLLET